MNSKFKKLFPIEKPIIGMIHLAGKREDEKIIKAIEELKIFEEEGIDGAIIENYHGTIKDVLDVLENLPKLEKLVIGINILSNPYHAFELTSKYNIKFIQFDSVQTQDLDIRKYNELKNKYPEIIILGGVGFKYIPPTGNFLEIDLMESKPRCDAVVTTGDGTGIETPIEKLEKFKHHLEDFPLIVGAGINSNNIYEQLKIANGAIIGSYFKYENNTNNEIDKSKVASLMEIVKKIRNK